MAEDRATLRCSNPGMGLKLKEPLSADWGASRGGPIDRFYIDAFVAANLAGRSGSILEFKDPRYRHFIQADRIESYDILDIDPDNPLATIRCDVESLCASTDKEFDVIICTQVLQYVHNPARALAELRGRMKPNGLIIVTAPFIERQDCPLPDRWRFTRLGIQSLLKDFRNVRVETGGNLLAVLSYLAGMGLDDMTEEDLSPRDPIYYTTVMARGEA